MVEYKERVLLPLSFEIEEEYMIFENQFEEQFEIGEGLGAFRFSSQTST